MLAISILTFVILGAFVAGDIAVNSPAARSSRFANAVRNIGAWMPPFALALLWAIAIGTLLATGSWPERCGIIFHPANPGEVVFVGNPPDGYWGLLRLLAQISLGAMFGILLGLPVARLRGWIAPARSAPPIGLRRSAVIVCCSAAVVASYWTTPGQCALEWIID